MYTGGSTIADGAGAYSFVVPYNWSGTVKASKAGYVILPASRSYSDVVVNQTGRNYTAHPLINKSFQSIATQDGWILETGENTNIGGLMNATAATFRLGDDASRRQYRAILSFNTGALPDNAVITSAKLALRSQAVVPAGSNPFSILQGLVIDVRNGYLGTSRRIAAS